MRRMLVCILTALVLVTGVPLRCLAADDRGSIRITLTKEEDRIYYGSVTLYRVGVPVSGGYRLGSGYGGGFVEEKDAQAPALAQWLAERVGIGDEIRVLDDNGCGEFRDLEEGLYLLVQTDPAEGFYPFVPFLVRLPYEGQWEVLAFPKLESLPVISPQTGDGFPMLEYGGVMAVSGLGLILCMERKRRKK